MTCFQFYYITCFPTLFSHISFQCLQEALSVIAVERRLVSEKEINEDVRDRFIKLSSLVLSHHILICKQYNQWLMCYFWFSPKDWALQEGNLHRLLGSKILSSYGRTSGTRQVSSFDSSHNLLSRTCHTCFTRRKGCNMSKLKTLVSMIYEDRAGFNTLGPPL